MKAPLEYKAEHELTRIPPLSQSRQGDMACEILYVRKHVQGGRLAESAPAARGIEIHQILATYINHLVRARRATDLEMFDSLLKSAGAEAREVLDRFRDSHAFDPEKFWLRSSTSRSTKTFIPPSVWAPTGERPNTKGPLTW